MKIKLKTIHALILLSIFSLMALEGRAQNNLLFYNSNDQFYSPGFNPAFLTTQEKFTFSIFPVSGISVGYNNQEVVKGMLKDIISGNFTEEHRNEVFKSLLKQDVFTQRFETPLFNFGYHSDLGTFNFRIQEIEQLRSGLKGDFTQFISDPEFLTIQLNQSQSLYANAMHYREFSLGYARELPEEKLSVGIRAKLYVGKASFFSQAHGQATGNMQPYHLKTHDPLKMSVPLDFYWDPEDSIVSGATLPKSFSPMDYLFNTQNMGLGIDLGITYQVNKKMQLSASVVDFGKINWKSNLNTLDLHGDYEIPTGYITDSGDNYITKDPAFATNDKDLNPLFKSVIDSSAYTSPLPTSFYLGAQYQMNSKLTLGVVDRYTQSKGMSQNSFSLTANYAANKKLTLISGLSTIGKSYANIPFALIYNWRSGQSYLGTDNLLAFFAPSSVDYAGITFGTCFFLFKPKVRYADTEYLPFYKEKKRTILKH